jgi:hypothetical protein
VDLVHVRDVQPLLEGDDAARVEQAVGEEFRLTVLDDVDRPVAVLARLALRGDEDPPVGTDGDRLGVLQAGNDRLGGDTGPSRGNHREPDSEGVCEALHGRAPLQR